MKYTAFQELINRKKAAKEAAKRKKRKKPADIKKETKAVAVPAAPEAIQQPEAPEPPMRTPEIAALETPIEETTKPSAAEQPIEGIPNIQEAPVEKVPAEAATPKKKQSKKKKKKAVGEENVAE